MSPHALSSTALAEVEEGKGGGGGGGAEKKQETNQPGTPLTLSKNCSPPDECQLLFVINLVKLHLHVTTCTLLTFPQDH